LQPHGFWVWAPGTGLPLKVILILTASELAWHGIPTMCYLTLSLVKTVPEAPVRMG
jgi:hypothetical protein